MCVPRAMFGLLLLSVACTPKDEDADSETQETGVQGEATLRSARSELVSKRSGLLDVAVDVRAGETSFLLTGLAESGLLSLDRLIDPSGTVVLQWEDWNAAPNFISMGVFANASDCVLAWPALPMEEPLMEGEWTARFATLDESYAYVGQVPVRMDVQQKADADLSRGVVRVSLRYARGVREAEGVEAAVEGALIRWEQLWDEIGISLEVEVGEADIDAALPYPFVGDPAYQAVTAESDDDQLVVIIGEEILTRPDLFGHVGTVPNSLRDTPRAAIGVAWLLSAGPDAKFNAIEVRLLGETLAHEAAHFTGVFHPVEADFSSWDALDDTPECTNRNACEQVYKEAVMFPYPLCREGVCVPAGRFSADQARVMQQYAGTR